MMNTNHDVRRKPIRYVLSLLLTALIACSTLDVGLERAPSAEDPVGETPIAATPTPVQAQPATPPPGPDEFEIPKEVDLVDTVTTSPLTPDPQIVGYTRSNPFPPSQLVKSLNADIQVLDVLRGDEAVAEAKAQNPYYPSSLEGQELLMVELSVKRTGDGDGLFFFSIPRVTGDRLLQYECDHRYTVGESVGVASGLSQEDVALGEQTEVWAFCFVGIGEGSLMLIDEGENGRDQFIALEEGISITTPLDLAQIQPNDLGKEIQNPVPFGQKMINEDWEISIQEVIRGEEAWTIIQDKDSFADPPEVGQEYILVKVKARCINVLENACDYWLPGFSSTLDNHRTRYEVHKVSDPPDLFDLNENYFTSSTIRVFPGGEIEIWEPLLGSRDETNLITMHGEWWWQGEDRFFSLNPSP